MKDLLELLFTNTFYFIRGAELINQTLIESVLKQKEEERQVLDNIKKKMDAIKEKQKHVKKDFVVPDEHFQSKFTKFIFLWLKHYLRYQGSYILHQN